VSYWELSEASRGLVEELNRYWGPSNRQIHRWLALTEEGKPVGKGSALACRRAQDCGERAPSVQIRDECSTGGARQGIAGALTDIALRAARELGCTRVVLHATQMAVGVYERAGFSKQYDLTVYADAPLWASRAR
jgi:GNAT superfamily N-acetyltransferase